MDHFKFDQLISLTAIPCEWGEWNNGACLGQCEEAIQIRTRNKTVHETNGGSCEGPNFEQTSCTLAPCQPSTSKLTLQMANVVPKYKCFYL